MLKKYKYQLIAAIVALLHLIITFFCERKVFTLPPSANLPDYIICKLLAFFILFGLYYGICLIFFDKEKGAELKKIVKWGLPYLPVMVIVTIFKLRNGFLSNDENLIYQNAQSLTHYTWFYYITTYYYIISMMLIPFKYAAVVTKLIIEFLVIGYFTYNISLIYGKKYGYFSYLLFLLYPMIAYTASAHRLPIYTFVYLYLFSTLYFDYQKADPKASLFKSLSLKKELWLIFIAALLTQWRTEGIYLVLISSILIIMVYGLYKNRKKTLMALFLIVLCQYLVSVPQNGFVAKELGAAATDRMKPFYAYTVTNMFRNGLDREKNKEDIELIDKYLSIEKIDAINDYYKDINYEDVLILYADGFIGVREEADVTEYFNFAAACKNLFINNPDVLLKTRWGAFLYAALPFKISFTGFGIKELLSFGLSVIKTLSYNLFIPVTVIAIVFIASLIKRRWFNFFTSAGLLCHLFIVFILAPASYFKYYFPVYLMGYFYLMIFIMDFFYIRLKKR
ncbi:MAG: hypothetical protein K5931_09685 [Lachnospiraceae bacterium]|nr:hypothetical protein [Lachnospiraceae bacterium]